MVVSTRGRYALRVMLDLAQMGEGDYIPMKNIAERQGISLKYLERILPALARNHLIEGTHGKGGGYRLCRSPKDYRIGEILRLTEGDFAPVACLEKDKPPCSRSGECRTLPMWKELGRIIEQYFDGIPLEDLLKEN